MLSLLAGITILLAAAWLLTATLRSASASLRHVIWTCAIVATLLYAPLRWRAPQRMIERPLPAVFTPAIVVTASAGESTVNFPEIALTIWALGSMLLGFRLLIRAAQFQALIRGGKRLEAAGPVPILTSARIPGPLVTGIFRPKILLPEDSSSWTPARRRAVLAHELAHIRRRDPAILLAAHLATILYWFHPLCWLAAAKLRAESERACDDAALRIGLLPSGYAGHLLDLARLFNPQPAIPMATTSHLESRVKSILDPVVNRSFASRRTWLVAALVTAAAMTPLTVFKLHAQQPGGSGNIVGIVTDPTGAVVARVPVVASNLAGGNKEITTSDLAGNFAFNNIPAGNYAVEAAAPGFAPFRLEVGVASGGMAKAPVRLHVGSVGERITVVATGAPRSTAPPATSQPRGKPIRVGGNVQVANLIEQVRPVYPPALQQAGVEGTVLFEAVISKEGAPTQLKVQNTAVDPGLVSAATDAVQQWRYRPSLLNGEPIEVLTTIAVDFKLQR